MKRKLKIERFKKWKPFFLIFVFISYTALSQELFVGPGSEFYLNDNIEFTTSNTTITKDFLGEFAVEAGNNWGSEQEYVDGEVTVYGAGETKIPIGNNGVYAPVMANHTGIITGFYSNSPPNSGSNGINVDAVGNVEYWQFTGSATITLPWNDSSDITSLVNNNGGALNSVAIVGLSASLWNLVSAAGSNVVTGNLLNGTVTSDDAIEVDLNNFSQFTFGIDHQIVLAVDDLFLSNGISILSNPVRIGDANIQFRSSNDLSDLMVTLFDIQGRKIRTYNNVSTYNGIGNLKKPNLPGGLYFLKFDHEGKQGIKKIILE